MKWMIAVLALVLAGCATPAGQIKSEDLVWADYEVNAPLATVYDGLQENSRQCNGLIDHYEPDWFPAQSGKSAKIDLYLPAVLWAKKTMVGGLIELKQVGSSTQMKVGIQKPYSNPVFRANEWWKPRVKGIVAEIEAGTPPSCK